MFSCGSGTSKPMPPKFSKQDVEKIEELAKAGLTGVAIAKQIGCKASAVRAKCAAMGLELRRPKPEFGARFSIPRKAFDKLSIAAASRGLSVNRLAALILETVAADDLVGGVLDHVPAVPDALPTSVEHADARRSSDEHTPAPISVTLTVPDKLSRLRQPQLVGILVGTI
jgi:hypothetical protein